MTATQKFTAGQIKFLTAVANGKSELFHVRVTDPLFYAGYVFPVPGAIFPWLRGCNGQSSGDYFLTEKGAALFEWPVSPAVQTPSIAA